MMLKEKKNETLNTLNCMLKNEGTNSIKFNLT